MRIGFVLIFLTAHAARRLSMSGCESLRLIVSSLSTHTNLQATGAIWSTERLGQIKKFTL